jgi:5-methylcytosine-specific restriction endonuclease McrA
MKLASKENFPTYQGQLTGTCKECLRDKHGTKKRANRNDVVLVDGVFKKPCTRCGEWKPANIDYFSPFKEGKLGLHPWCKECVKANKKEYYYRTSEGINRHDKPKVIDGVLCKKCRTCAQWFPATSDNFVPQKGCTLDLRPTCRVCARLRSIDYAENHKETVIKRVREWIKNNKSRHRQFSLAVKAKRRAAEGSFKADDIQKHWEMQNGKCFYCLVDLDQTYEVDHFIPLSKGGTNLPDNIVLACKSCNRAKSSKDPHKFLEKMRSKRQNFGNI